MWVDPQRSPSFVCASTSDHDLYYHFTTCSRFLLSIRIRASASYEEGSRRTILLFLWLATSLHLCSVLIQKDLLNIWFAAHLEIPQNNSGLGPLLARVPWGILHYEEIQSLWNVIQTLSCNSLLLIWGKQYYSSLWVSRKKSDHNGCNDLASTSQCYNLYTYH